MSLNFNIISVLQVGQVTSGQIHPLCLPAGGKVNISTRLSGSDEFFEKQLADFSFFKL